MRCLCVGATPKKPAKKPSPMPRGAVSWRHSDDRMRRAPTTTTTGPPISSSSSPTMCASSRLVHHQSLPSSNAAKPTTAQSPPFSRTSSRPAYEGLEGNRGLPSRGTTRQVAADGPSGEPSATSARSEASGAPINNGNNFCGSPSSLPSLPPAFNKTTSLPRQRFNPTADRGTSTAVAALEPSQPHRNDELSSLLLHTGTGIRSMNSLGSRSDHAPNGEESSSSSSSSSALPPHYRHQTILRAGESLTTSDGSRPLLKDVSESVGVQSVQKRITAAERSQVLAEDGRIPTSMFLSIGHVQDVPIDPAMDISFVEMVAVLHLESEDPAELLDNRKRATKPVEVYHDQAASIGCTINAKKEMDIGEFGMNEAFRVAVFLRGCGESDVVFVGTTGRLCAKLPQLSLKATKWPLVNRELRKQAGAVKLRLEINSGEKHFKLGRRDVE